jgi:hypothetical protein
VLSSLAAIAEATIGVSDERAQPALAVDVFREFGQKYAGNMASSKKHPDHGIELSKSKPFL